MKSRQFRLLGVSARRRDNVKVWRWQDQAGEKEGREWIEETMEWEDVDLDVSSRDELILILSPAPKSIKGKKGNNMGHHQVQLQLQ